MPTPSTPAFIPLPDEGAGSLNYWRDQLAWAADIRQKKLAEWRMSAAAYAGTLPPPEPRGIRVNIEFEKTEQKKHQLFFRLPAIKLRATPRTIRESLALDPQGQMVPNAPPRRDLKKAIAILQEVITYQLGPKGAHAKALMDELIFDVLCPAGIGFAKLGYERYTQGTIPIQVGQQPDPQFQQPGAVLGLSIVPPMVPVMAQAPNIVCEQYYASRISPARGLVPAEFMGSDFNKADWLAHDFFITPDTAKRNKWDVNGADIQASDRMAVSQDDRIVKLDETGRRTGQIQCRELFYYPANLGLHDNPDKIRRVVFVGSNRTPVVHEDFRDQRFDARGKWIGGLKRHPIKVYTLRYVSDSSHPPSDCQITRGYSDELSQFRTQQMKHRRKAVPRSAVNVDAFVNDKIKQKFIDGEHYDDIPVSGRTDNISTPIGTPSIPHDNARSEQEIKSDIDRAWALPRDSAAEPGNTTATEVATVARTTATRLAGETGKTTAFFLEIAEGLGSLVQLYADREDYVEITGESGATQIEAWDRETIAGEWLYEIVPDSSQPPDAAGDRDLALNLHNIVANSPYIDGEKEMRSLVEAYGREPDGLVKQPNPPPPEKPKINLAVNGKDLDPTAPQYQNVINVLIAAGIPAQQLAPVASHDPAADPTKPAPVVDRERLRMAEADNQDHRGGGLVGVGA